nr:cytochrome P450 CYP4Q84 [Monolepta hieroglyphica]
MIVVDIIVSALLLVVGYYVVVFIKDWIWIIYLSHKIPGPGKSFILGSLLDILGDEVKVFKKLREWGKEYQSFYMMAPTFLYPTFNVTGPEEVEQIISTTKNLEKGHLYNFLFRWLGEGLLTSTDSKWHTRRKILTPAFHFNILQQFLTIFNKETRLLVEVLKNETEKPWTNVIPRISQFTLKSIVETSMGTSLNLENTEDKDYVKAIYKFGKSIAYRSTRPWMYYNSFYYMLIPAGWKEMKVIDVLHSFTNKIVAKKSENFEKFDVPADDDYNYSKRKKLAFLDLLLNSKFTDGIIDDEGIKDEVNTFMFEGHDTTSSSICFTLMLLANHPNFQEQIYQEIITVLGDSDKDPDLNELNELKLMERFIKESLRLYPSVPLITRKHEKESYINEYLIPKDVELLIHIYDIHRNPKHWPDPERFDPDRFLPENCVGRHPYAYIPFSAGPRNCIGQRFAMLELKAVLCGILRNFVLEPVDTRDTIEMIIELVLRTNNESLKVKFCPRNS